MLKNRFTYVTDSELQCAMTFARSNRGLVAPHHMLQKLIIFELVAPVIAQSNHGRILEIGCGIGIHSAMLTKFGDVSATDLAAPGSFVGADRGVDQVRERVFSALGQRPVSFKYNDGTRLDYPDQTFDLVFHNSVIEHVPDVVAFNREVLRVLKPNGICICITGTPTLCNFRLLRHWVITAPTQLAVFVLREFAPQGLHRFVGRLASGLGVSSAKVDKFFERIQPLGERIDAVLALEASAPEPAPLTIHVRDLYARLHHFLYFPRYNRLVIDRIANSLGVTAGQVLMAVREHFATVSNRFMFTLCPRTHGQHYHGAMHEREEWKIPRWRRVFDDSGFKVTRMYGYRYHQILECMPSYRWDSALYYRAVPWIRQQILGATETTTWASEIVIVARRSSDRDTGTSALPPETPARSPS